VRRAVTGTFGHPKERADRCTIVVNTHSVPNSMLTDTVALVAVLFGSITAGIVFARPVRASRDKRRRGKPTGERPVPTRKSRFPALPEMLGGDILPIFAREPKAARRPRDAAPARVPQPNPVARRPAAPTQRAAPWSTAAVRPPTTDVG
jgi:hypothetical protein